MSTLHTGRDVGQAGKRESGSLASTTRRLFQGQSKYPWLDGIRGISILWVIVFHCVWSVGFFAPKEAFEVLCSNPVASVILRGHFGVDIFFVLSGFLIGGILLDERDKRGSIDVLRFYKRRLLRLMPVYLAVMLLLICVGAKNSSQVWANVLYVNNLLPVQEQFMPWTWSLAIEEQFYLLCPLLIVVSRHRFLQVSIALVLLSIVIRFGLCLTSDVLLPVPFHAALGEEAYYRYFDTVYTKPYTRYDGLLIGAMVAYVQRYRRPLTGPKATVLLVAGLAIATVFAIIPPSAETKTPILSALVLSGLRVVFSLSIGAIFWGLLNLPQRTPVRILYRFLSLRFWYPVAQLSYSAYLLQLVIIFGLWREIDQTHGIGALKLIAMSALAIVGTFILSFVFYLLIEAPFLRIREHYWPRTERTKATDLEKIQTR